MKNLSIASIAFLFLIAVSIQLFYSSCKKDICENLKCWNGGTCLNGVCECATGWSGETCLTPVANTDPCSNIICQNGGTCVDGTCNCASGYEGVNCEIETRAKFIRTWNVSQNSSLFGTSGYSLTVLNDTSINSVLIENIWNEFTVTNATVNGNNITIPFQFQTVSSTIYYIGGTGTFNNNQILWNYSITNTNTSVIDNCTATWQ